MSLPTYQLPIDLIQKEGKESKLTKKSRKRTKFRLLTPSIKTIHPSLIGKSSKVDTPMSLPQQTSQCPSPARLLDGLCLCLWWFWSTLPCALLRTSYHTTLSNKRETVGYLAPRAWQFGCILHYHDAIMVSCSLDEGSETKSLKYSGCRSQLARAGPSCCWWNVFGSFCQAMWIMWIMAALQSAVELHTKVIRFHKAPTKPSPGWNCLLALSHLRHY